MQTAGTIGKRRMSKIAKVTFIFEDTPNGVLIKSDPSLEQLVVLKQSNNQATNAHNYALTAWLAFCKASNPTKPGAGIKVH